MFFLLVRKQEKDLILLKRKASWFSSILWKACLLIGNQGDRPADNSNAVGLKLRETTCWHMSLSSWNAQVCALNLINNIWWQARIWIKQEGSQGAASRMWRKLHGSFSLGWLCLDRLQWPQTVATQNNVPAGPSTNTCGVQRLPLFFTDFHLVLENCISDGFLGVSSDSFPLCLFFLHGFYS